MTNITKRMFYKKNRDCKSPLSIHPHILGLQLINLPTYNQELCTSCMDISSGPLYEIHHCWCYSAIVQIIWTGVHLCMICKAFHIPWTLFSHKDMLVFLFSMCIDILKLLGLNVRRVLFLPSFRWFFLTE